MKNLVSETIIQQITSKNSARFTLSSRSITSFLSTTDKQGRYAISVISFITGRSVCQTNQLNRERYELRRFGPPHINIPFYKRNTNLSNKQHHIRLRHQFITQHQICMKPTKNIHHRHHRYHSSVPRIIWHLNTSKGYLQRMLISGIVRTRGLYYLATVKRIEI